MRGKLISANSGASRPRYLQGSASRLSVERAAVKAETEAAPEPPLLGAVVGLR